MADRETPKQTERRLHLEERTRAIAEVINEMVPENTTFMLFLADVGDKGNLAYVGTSQRESTIEMMREFLQRWGANQ